MLVDGGGELAAVETFVGGREGMFWIVLRTGASLWVIVTCVPVGNGSGTRLVLFFMRPHVRPPSELSVDS